jgi:hypothetical protein
MSSTMMTDRGMAATAFAGPAAPWQAASSHMAAPATANWMVPRCKYEFEKCAGGFKIHCSCEDEVACGTLQNLCRMLSDGLCSCCCTCNGITICQCNLAIGLCHCEMTKDGCSITCTSGDKKCAAMLQACCDCLAACCCEPGCCCYISFNNTPCCCGKC